MIRLVLILLGAVALSAGLSWLADQPGSISITWPGYVVETSIFRAAVIAALLIGASIFLWSIARQIWTSPAAVGRFFHRRRQERGLDALSSGMIAIGAGDRALATRYAVQARKALPNEPLTHLLRAQAAQLSGDRTTSRRIFEAMLGSPDTEQLGLRGLFLEAEREGETEAARQFAARAMALNPKLSWAIDALFELQCKDEDWSGALETLTVARKNGLIEKPDADRRRAVLLTARAQALEDGSSQKALALAQEAHGLAPDLVPAAAIAARQLASRGNTPKAAKIIEKTWKFSPHPDLATVYAFARPGDSPRDRLERVQRLARLNPHSSEGPIAVAATAIEAHNWGEARKALAPLLEGRLSQRVCTLMARIENGERANQGGVREWVARAVHAPRDPAWTADGIVSDTWKPISPVTGALDAFQWKVPTETAQTETSEQMLERMEELVMLGNGVTDGPVIDAKERDTSDDHNEASDSVVAEPARGVRPTVGGARKADAEDTRTVVTVETVPGETRQAAASSAEPTATTAAGRASGSTRTNGTGNHYPSPAPPSGRSISGEAPTSATTSIPPPPVIVTPVAVDTKPQISIAKPVAPAAVPGHGARGERAATKAQSSAAAVLSGSVSVAAIEAVRHDPVLTPVRPLKAQEPKAKPSEPQLFVPPRTPTDPDQGDIDAASRSYRAKQR